MGAALNSSAHHRRRRGVCGCWPSVTPIDSIPSTSPSPSARVVGFRRLLGPLLVNKRGLLLAVIVLGLLSAFGQNAPILLIEPLWPAMFPEAEALNNKPKALQQAFDWLRRQVLPDVDPQSPQARFQAVYVVAGALAVIGLLAGLATYSFAKLSRKLSLTLVIELRERLARHLMGLSLRYHGRRELGDVMSRVTADVQTTLFSIDLVLRDLVQEPARAAVGLGIAIYAAPQLTVTLLVALPLLALPVALLSKRVRKGSTKSLTSLGVSVQAMTQMFLGVRTVKAFRAEARELENYRQLNREFLRQSMKMARSIALTRASTTFLSNLGLGVMLVLIAWLVIERRYLDNGGNVSMFFIGVAQAYNHLRRTTQSVTQLQESMGAAVRLQALLEEQPDLVEQPNAVPLPGLGSGIDFEAVRFSYDPRERPALTDFSLHLRAGETLALVGPSGSGKSTLIDLVARFIDPSAGRAWMIGAACSPWSAKCRTCSTPPSARTSATAAPRRPKAKSKPPPAPPRSTTSSLSCPTATPPMWPTPAHGSPAGNASASPSPAPCSGARPCCCSTKPPAPSTARPNKRYKPPLRN
jgi:ABC-type multidrug transport system fused ATPase/permease subunit